MEYLIFRILRLIDREIEMYDKLNVCLTKQHDNIVNGNIMDLIMDMIEQREIGSIISDIENDIKEEIIELAHILNVYSENPNITVIVEALKNKYPKFCGFFKTRSKKLNIILSKVNQINAENILLLKNYKTVWKDIIPLYSTWKEIEPLLEYETENENVEEPVYESKLN